MDLNDRRYTPTATYLEAGMVSGQETLYTDYVKLSWFLPYNEPLIVKEYPGQRLYEELFAIDELFQNDFALERLNLTKDGAIDTIWFKRGDDYKAVTLSMEKDGQLLAEITSRKSDHFSNPSLAWVHGDTERLYKDVAEDDTELRAAIDQDISKKTPGQSYYSFRFKLQEGATVNFMDTVTLKLTDPKSGKTLYSKDILLSNKEIFDQN